MTFLQFVDDHYKSLYALVIVAAILVYHAIDTYGSRPKTK